MNNKIIKNTPVFLGAVVLPLILILAIVIRMPFIHEALDRDTGLFAVIGKYMNEGLFLYRDAIDNKPPGIFAIFYLLFKSLPVTSTVVYLFLACWAAVTTLLVFVFTEELIGRKEAYLSALIFAIFSSSPFVEGSKAMVENFMITFVILGLYLFFVSRRYNRNMILLLCSGVSLGIGFLFKQVAAFDFMALILYIVLISICVKAQEDAGPRLFLKRLFFISSGFLLPFIVSLLYFYFNNSLEDYLFCFFTFNIKYAHSLGYSSGHYWDKFFYYNSDIIRKLSFIWIGGFLFLASIIYNGVKLKWYLKELFLAKSKKIFLFLWLALIFAGACSSGRFFPHYYITLIPVLSIMTGCIILRLFSSNLKYKLFIMAIMASALFYSAILHYKFYFVYNPEIISMKNYPWQPFVEAREIGFYIKEHTKPQDYIYIWAEEPQICFYAQRKSVDRYWKNTPFIYFASFLPNAPAEVFASLRIKKPKYIVIDTRHIPDLKRYKEIDTFIKSGYYIESEFKVIRDNIWGYSLLVCRAK